MPENTKAEHKLKLPYIEFILLLTTMSALIAMSVDTVLPALDLIGESLQVQNLDDTQLVISFLFLGMALSQVFYGPLSDAFGRKPVIYVGLVLFIIGSLCSLYAQSYTMMLFGRVLQGIGVASPRVVSMAIVRDLFKGRAMARVMSYTMSIFILIPVIAPSIGQLILLVADWHMIFWLILLMALVLLLWIALRLDETLPSSARVPLTATSLYNAFLCVMTTPVTMIYTLMSGIVFGVFLSYLSSAQQLFQGVYQTGKWFPLLFALLAISMGIANFFNARVVVRLGMRLLVKRSLLVMLVVSLVFLPVVLIADGVPGLGIFMVYLAVVFFCVALQFGNLSSMAMEPLGEVAGMGAGIIGSISTIIAMPIGVALGRTMDTEVTYMVLGFVLCPIACLLLMRLDPTTATEAA